MFGVSPVYQALRPTGDESQISRAQGIPSMTSDDSKDAGKAFLEKECLK